MSYYYNYYIGYISKGKIYPFGPYNSFDNLRAVVCKSSSFASDLHESFYDIKDDQISEELRKEFTETDWEGKECVPVKYLYLDELPKGSFIKHGYFLIDDVKRYEKDKDSFDLFYDMVTPTIYAAMMQHEAQFGKPDYEEDDFGERYRPHSASDYMYYSYPDYNSKEYEAFIIREVAGILEMYSGFPEDAKIVVLETEG